MIASSGLMRKCERIWDTATESISCPVERAGKKRIHLYFNVPLWEKALAAPSSPHSRPLLPPPQCSADYSRACWGFHAADCQEKSRSPCAFYAFELPLLHFQTAFGISRCAAECLQSFFSFSLFLFVLSEVEIQQHTDEKIFISYKLGMWQICFICTGLRQFELHRL